MTHGKTEYAQMNITADNSKKLYIDNYLAKRFDIGPFKFAPIEMCNGCHNVRRIIHFNIQDMGAYCYDCFCKNSAEDAMAHGDMRNQYWKFLVSIGRNKMVEDLLYEYDPSIDIRPPFKPDDEEVVDEED